MKTTISYIVAIMLVIISYTANGQQVQTKDDRAKMEARGLKKQLSLTDAQAVQCEQIIKKYAVQLSEIKPNKSDSTQTAKRYQLIKKRNNELKAVLNTDQQVGFDKWMEEKQQHRGKAMRKDSISGK